MKRLRDTWIKGRLEEEGGYVDMELRAAIIPLQAWDFMLGRGDQVTIKEKGIEATLR